MSKDELSGADIKAVCTEAGMLALRERRMKVTHDDFEKAKEKALYRKKVRPATISRARARPLTPAASARRVTFRRGSTCRCWCDCCAGLKARSGDSVFISNLVLSC